MLRMRARVRACVRIAAFESIVLLAILLNCLFMALPFADLEAQSEVYFVALFTLEMAFKMLTFGFLCHRQAYLLDGWNLLDFTVVVTGIAALVLRAQVVGDGLDASTNSQLGAIPALRAMRVLRPLRTISRLSLIHI